MSIGTFVVIWLIIAVITAAIAQRKNLPVGQAFFVGAVLGIIGLIIVLFQTPGLPKAPPGMRAVKCSRCNTVQNIPENQPTYECWQCKAAHRLWGEPPKKVPSPPADRPKVNAPRKSTKVKCSKCQPIQSVSVSQATFECTGMRHKAQAQTAIR